MILYAVWAVASNELARLVRSPIVAFTVGLLLILSIINACGSTVLLPALASNGISNTLITVGFANITYETSLIISFLALSIGVSSIADERSNKSLSLLISKPMYRRDIIIGKILGSNLFMVGLISVTLAVFVSMMMVVYPSTFSTDEFLLRLGTYFILLIINCTLTIGISLLISILVKNYLGSLIISTSFLFIGWFSHIGSIAGNLMILNPVTLYLSIFAINRIVLYNTQIPYTTWLSSALPNIVMLTAEAIIISMICCFAFNFEDL